MISDQLMFATPSSSSSNPEKLMSTRILLRLSFIVFRTRPSVNEWFVGEVPSMRGSVPRQVLWRSSTDGSPGPVVLEGPGGKISLGELKRGQSLKGVPLKLNVLYSCRGVTAGPPGVRIGLKSRMFWLPLPTGVTFQGSGTTVEGGLLGVEEISWLLAFMGVLKENSWSMLCCGKRCSSSSVSCMLCEIEASEATPESKRVLSGQRRTGSSCWEWTSCCLRRDLLACVFGKALGHTPMTGALAGSLLKSRLSLFVTCQTHKYICFTQRFPCTFFKEVLVPFWSITWSWIKIKHSMQIGLSCFTRRVLISLCCAKSQVSVFEKLWLTASLLLSHYLANA